MVVGCREPSWTPVGRYPCEAKQRAKRRGHGAAVRGRARPVRGLSLSLGLGLSLTFSVSTSASRVALLPRRAGNAGFIVQRRAGGAADFEDLVTYNTFAPLKTKGVQVLSKTQ